ncbi:isopentenyl-diphosphate Delta-isomerase [Crocinitomix catalasitica]|uniref:isopentenyl-diphosphate Delta-isomerase n=1 Tax=Crocinitomix catalasitica TaxID=184607 RepID=UPI0004828513|nr:isopentenyl-diphosphate Delta-isomerase [Crocinitomix catalasitica]
MVNVILVNDQDEPTGLMEKLEAHRQGLLHRAFSVFVFNNQQQLLLQRRAKSKYHSGGLWTNTCCSHPLDGETVEEAAERRLVEEMGFTCDMELQFNFIYRAELDQGMIENEFDHVLFGTYNEAPEVNPEEVGEWKYMDISAISIDLEENPEAYTAWFKIIFDRVIKHLADNPISV